MTLNGAVECHPLLSNEQDLRGFVDVQLTSQVTASLHMLQSAAAACVLCGELSLLAAQTNPGELMEAHRRLERDS